MEFYKESEIFKALGHPIRLGILKCLMSDTCDCNVNMIVEKLNIPQSTISQHIGILRNKGIINPRKKGTATCYVITDENILNILKLIKIE